MHFKERGIGAKEVRIGSASKGAEGRQHQFDAMNKQEIFSNSISNMMQQQQQQTLAFMDMMKKFAEK